MNNYDFKEFIKDVIGCTAVLAVMLVMLYCFAVPQP